MSTTKQLASRKTQLLREIQQQRLDLSSTSSQWLHKTESLDDGWRAMTKWRKYLIAGTGILAIYGIRRPSRLIKWSRRAVSAVGTLRIIRRTLSN